MKLSVVSRTSVTTILLPCSSCGLFPSTLLKPAITDSDINLHHSGAWIVLPTYMIYIIGTEILAGLELASGETKKTQ